MSLASEAVVRQTTGEDWSGVSLRLSTAAPARGVQPPRLAAWFIKPMLPVTIISSGAGAEYGGGTGGFARVEGARERDFKGSVDGVNNVDPLSGTFMANQRYDVLEHGEIITKSSEVAVVSSAYNIAFEVPGGSDVPADGRDHRVHLRQETLTGEVGYRTVPAIHPAAFLVSRTRAPGGYPLLAGPVRVFAGAAYLGSFELEETAPEAEVTLPFGLDNRVRIERTPLPRERGTRGLTGKTRHLTFAFRTSVKNLRDEAVILVLEDRIPVSEDEQIQVDVDKATTPGYAEDPDRPGVLEWTLDLVPGEKREIHLEYAVRYPGDLVVPGLG